MNELYELTERHVSGESTPEEQARLRELLHDKTARAVLVRHVTLMAAVRDSCKATDQAAVYRQRVKEADATAIRRNVRWFPRFLALAASLTIIAGGVWWLKPAAGLGLRVVQANGEWRVVRGQWSVSSEVNMQQPMTNNQQPSRTRAVVGMELRQGDRMVVKGRGKATLKYDGEETRIELVDASDAGFGAEKGAKRVQLGSGTLVCTVAPQKLPFEIQTPHAVARVIGTQFTLKADADATRIEVVAGLVRVTRSEDNASVDVPAGHRTVVSRGTDLLAEPTHAPRALLGLDFEDGSLPSRSGGTIEEGGGAKESRFCVAGSRDKEYDCFRVHIENGEGPLFTYRDGAVLSFDYWVKKPTGAIDVYFWNQTRSTSPGYTIYGPAQEQWTRVAIRLLDTKDSKDRIPRDGDHVWNLTIQTTKGGHELFVDNIRIEVPVEE